ncbi:MAG: indole-3-glycerol phosphate synthase TrpC [Oscillospiraceae bacterium]|jgi:indole-3-glycerol phosphate synthase|nr:indole-3-glycerol phosphate synthase TrpC [Oscillospiraceae bacterium]
MILDDLAAHARERVSLSKKQISMDAIQKMAFSIPKGHDPFFQRLNQDGISFICEVKKASPSKGVIDPDFPYLQIAKEYESAGADCISCLTEPQWFLGSDSIFRDIRSNVSLPMIRKDFIVEEYQLYESKCMGADAILLICALLDTATISRYLSICHTLGLSALVEAHNTAEIESAVAAGARIIGVNNRNLKDFSVHSENAAKLRSLVPREILFVAESGIQAPSDLAPLKAARVDAVLIGEAMMRAKDKAALLSAFRQEVL